MSLKLPKFNKELSNSSKFYATGLFKSDKLKTDWSVSTSLSTSKSLKYLCETFLHSVAKWPFTPHLCQLQFLYAQSLAMCLSQPQTVHFIEFLRWHTGTTLTG